MSDLAPAKYTEADLLCVCGHDVDEHSHLLGCRVPVEALKCPCRSFRIRMLYGAAGE